MFLEIKFEKPLTSFKDNNKMLHAFIELFQINKTEKHDKRIIMTLPSHTRQRCERFQNRLVQFDASDDSVNY